MVGGGVQEGESTGGLWELETAFLGLIRHLGLYGNILNSGTNLERPVYCLLMGTWSLPGL